MITRPKEEGHEGYCGHQHLVFGPEAAEGQTVSVSPGIGESDTGLPCANAWSNPAGDIVGHSFQGPIQEVEKTFGQLS